eukprot:TRINITY_DN221_c0_g1_i4.p1 TRINITY_DN221_c0_g1~~TRINITY_DN221_c0_g1_i4.p1  ORF type:complete len:160 (+),score=16.22 TRINITY_DN221_c0_g1_i4:156-635(+)
MNCLYIFHNINQTFFFHIYFHIIFFSLKHSKLIHALFASIFVSDFFNFFFFTTSPSILFCFSSLQLPRLCSLPQLICNTYRSAASVSLMDVIPDVVIDEHGVFKYVLIEISDASGAKKLIVRGWARAEYHDDIYQEVKQTVGPKGFRTDIKGGGRISHE